MVDLVEMSNNGFENMAGLANMSQMLNVLGNENSDDGKTSAQTEPFQAPKDNKICFI